jgi:benzoate membrane transport protein
VATFVGFAASVAVVLSAAKAVGATPVQSASWVAGLCLSKAVATTVLSVRYRIPMICAWSTAGAALFATTKNVTIHMAVGAFLVSALLTVATAAIGPLRKLVERIPSAIAGAMLAGVLSHFVFKAFDSVTLLPKVVVPMIVVFFVVRVRYPLYAILIALAVGAILCTAFGLVHSPGAFHLTRPVYVSPKFDLGTSIGLGVPLYLVTMAGQHLPGFAVLRLNGYEPIPVRPALFANGIMSGFGALLGAHTIGMAAISASICVGPEAHPDPKQRWKTAPVYTVCYIALALAAAYVIAVLNALPPAFIPAIAGLGLIGSFTGALASAFVGETQRFAAVVTFAVSASSLKLAGIGSAFWGLTAGIVLLGLEKYLVPSTSVSQPTSVSRSTRADTSD